MQYKLKESVLKPLYVGESIVYTGFHGWNLPLHFGNGIPGEHRIVRESAGIFDISHMGIIFIEGAGAGEFVNYLTTANVISLPAGRCRYSFLCNREGGIIDDIVIYKFSSDKFMFVVNASNYKKVTESIISISNPTVKIKSAGSGTALIAVQGPKSAEEILPIIGPQGISLGKYTFHEIIRHEKWKIIVSRTGYTGEDGFEISGPVTAVGNIWTELVRSHGIAQCGLGARDTLRIEAGYPLYGNEIDETITPYQIGYGRLIDISKKDFIGKEALAGFKMHADTRRLCGIVMIDNGVPRRDCRVFQDKRQVGRITSGTRSPSTGRFIALAFAEGTEYNSHVHIEINGKMKAGVIVPCNRLRD